MQYHIIIAFNFKPKYSMCAKLQLLKIRAANILVDASENKNEDIANKCYELMQLIDEQEAIPACAQSKYGKTVIEIMTSFLRLRLYGNDQPKLNIVLDLKNMGPKVPNDFIKILARTGNMDTLLHSLWVLTIISLAFHCGYLQIDWVGTMILFMIMIPSITFLYVALNGLNDYYKFSEDLLNFGELRLKANKDEQECQQKIDAKIVDFSAADLDSIIDLIEELIKINKDFIAANNIYVADIDDQLSTIGFTSNKLIVLIIGAAILHTMTHSFANASQLHNNTFANT